MSDRKIPKYMQLKRELLSWLESGRLAPGAQFPSENEIAEKVKLSRQTVRQTFGELEKEGWLTGTDSGKRDVRQNMQAASSRVITYAPSKKRDKAVRLLQEPEKERGGSRCGLKIPGDLSLIGFNDSILATASHEIDNAYPPEN